MILYVGDKMDSLNEIIASIKAHEAKKKGILSKKEVDFLYALSCSSNPNALDTTDVNLEAVLNQLQVNLANLRIITQQNPGLSVMCEHNYNDGMQKVSILQGLIQNQNTKADNEKPAHTLS